MAKSLTSKKRKGYTKSTVKKGRKKTMSKEQKIIIGIITGVILILGVLIFLLNGKNVDRVRESKTGVKEAEQIRTVPSLIPTLVPKKAETIMVSSTGFVPDKLTIRKGTFINFANFSAASVDVESDDHPTHKLFPILNIGVLANGDTSEQKMFDTPGVYKFHNHLAPNQKGMIIVQ